MRWFSSKLLTFLGKLLTWNLFRWRSYSILMCVERGVNAAIFWILCELRASATYFSTKRARCVYHLTKFKFLLGYPDLSWQPNSIQDFFWFLLEVFRSVILTRTRSVRWSAIWEPYFSHNSTTAQQHLHHYHSKNTIRTTQYKCLSCQVCQVQEQQVSQEWGDRLPQCLPCYQIQEQQVSQEERVDEESKEQVAQVQ